MNMLGIAGFLMMFVMVFLLLKSKTIPAVVFVVLPIVTGLLVGFTPAELCDYIAQGISSVSTTAILFIFAVIFFGIMSDAGVFERIVNKVVGFADNNVLILFWVTILIAFIGHLDGSGATTLLITIPPLLPIYRRLGIRPIVLLGITCLTMGVMNMVPWGGPCGRLATALEVGTADIWKYCIPAQAAGLVFIALTCVFLAKREKKLGAGAAVRADKAGEDAGADGDKEDIRRPGLFWVNTALILVVVAVLVLTKIPTHITFLVAMCIALVINYPSQKMQDQRIKAHATSALTMAFTALASGALIGIMGKSPMLDAMTQLVLGFMPESLAPHLHVAFGFVNNPLSMIIHGDALIYGIIPIINQITSPYGIPPAAVGAAFLITFGPAIYIMPMTAATYLGLGLADVELKDHIKFAYPLCLGCAVVMLAFVVITGIIPF